ncbi:hypothetical protein SprV_0401534500 [Sparganum proliferum]
MSGKKISTSRAVEIPQYDGTESFTVWLRRAKFYLREVSEGDRSRTLLKTLVPKQLDKALDVGLDADLPFDTLRQRPTNLFGQTRSFGDVIEQLHDRRLKRDETLNQLVEDLERLTTVAYPSLGTEDKDNTVLYYFIKALPSSELSQSLVLQPPRDLQDAIDRAERYLGMDSATQGHPEHAYRHHWRRPGLAPEGDRYPPRPRFTSPNYNQYNQQGRPFCRPGGRPPFHNQACTCSRTPESLVFQHHRPKFWARYVDDTFVVIERDQVLTFQEHLNAVFPDIQFTMEEEENNQLAFLDVLVCRKDCGGLKTKVFRKATNTIQVLNFNSNHPISHKRSCVRTLYRRVETHCSEPEDKIAELKYLRWVFKANGYPCNFVNRCIRKRNERPNRTDTKSSRALPYVKNVSEAVGRLLAPLGVGIAHRPEATIRRLVMKPKDPLPRQETSGVVYRIWCSCGESNYVGETGRQLRTRMAEHAAAVRRNDASSQVAAHPTGPGHTFQFDEAEILARVDNRVSRELLESWFPGPQSINKCNELPLPYSVLKLRLGGVIGHAGSAQVNTRPNTRIDASDSRAIITPTSNARDEIAAINDANIGHQAINTPRATIPDEGVSRE